MLRRVTTVEPLGKALTEAGTPRPDVSVRVSREIVTLLSEQLYSSPLKAIEELVVNSFDADATECRLAVPAMAGTRRLGRSRSRMSGSTYGSMSEKPSFLAVFRHASRWAATLDSVLPRAGEDARR
jgi:hypothetical protein